MKLLNAFSVNMLDLHESIGSALSVTVTRAALGEVRAALLRGMESCVGHADTAAVIGSLLDLSVPYARNTVKMAAGERAVLAQYIGPRLPEGATKLPDGGRIDFFFVDVTLPDVQPTIV